MLLMASVLIGPGLSFHKIYLFHLMLAPAVIRSISFESIKNFSKDHKILLCLLLYSALSVLWSTSMAVGMKNFAYMLLGVSFVYVILSSSIESYKLLKVILWVMILNLSVSVSESLSLFRFPISKYSPYSPFFGHNYSGNLTNIPTGFHHNPNNNAFFILIFTPLILSVLKGWRLVSYLAVSTFVVFMASSKLILLAWILLLVILSIFFLWQKNGLKKTVFSLLALGLILLSLFTLPQGRRLDKYKRTIPSLVTFSIEAPTLLFNRLKGEEVHFNYRSIDGSLHERLIYLDGIAKIISSKWLFGAGGGSLESSFNTQGNKTMSMKHPHFYFLEMFAKYGIFFLGLYLFWMGRLYLSVKRVNFLYGLSLLLFALFNPVIASGVYFLPKWGLFAVLLKVSKESSGGS